MSAEVDFPLVTGEAAPIPAVSELPETTPARVPVAVRCRCCGFGWVTALPLPAPCISCHRGWRQPAGFADDTPLVIVTPGDVAADQAGG